MTLASTLLACSGSPGARADSPLRVVTTIVPLQQFVQQVGGPHVRCTVMIPPGASPHTYEPVPTQLKELSQADMYFKAGSGLEFEITWLPKLIELNPEMRMVNASQGIALLSAPGSGNRESVSETVPTQRRADSHIWLSPKNAAVMVQNIAQALREVDPDRDTEYQSRQNRYVARLQELDADIAHRLAPFNRRRFMVFHPAWGYFARDYELIQIPIEIEGKQPSPRDLVQLVARGRELGIAVIFVSPQFSTKSARVIAAELDARLVPADPLASDYIQNLRQITAELVEGLQ